MTPDVVVDIGNSRMKWWFCSRATGPQYVLRLDPDDHDAAADVLTRGGHTGPLCWAVASVYPQRTRTFTDWLTARGQPFVLIEDRNRLGLAINVDSPAKVGWDRLLNALAVKSSVAPGTPAVIADVGTAVTVDLLDESGAFAGGVIFPGPELMARALHAHTAQLPLVDLTAIIPALPAKNTSSAIHAGVVHAVVGGITRIVRHLSSQCRSMPEVFLTGGGMASLVGELQDALDFPVRHEPLLTLEGIRLAAEALP